MREVTASGVRCGELAAAVHGGLGVEAHVDLVGKQVLGRRRLDVAVAAPDAVGNPTQIGAKLVHQLLRRFLGEPVVLVVQQRLLPRRTTLPITSAVVKLLTKRLWIPIGAWPEGRKLEPERPIAEVVSPTADLRFSSIKTLFGFYCLAFVALK